MSSIAQIRGGLILAGACGGISPQNHKVSKGEAPSPLRVSRGVSFSVQLKACCTDFYTNT